MVFLFSQFFLSFKLVLIRPTVLYLRTYLWITVYINKYKGTCKKSVIQYYTRYKDIIIPKILSISVRLNYANDFKFKDRGNGIYPVLLRVCIEYLPEILFVYPTTDKMIW